MHDATTQIVEALLFVSSEPVEPTVLAGATGLPVEDIKAAIDTLREHYVVTAHGLRVETTIGGVQLVTAPDLGPAVAALRGTDRPPSLSAAAQDVLAIVAYRQPVTRGAIEMIRGVGSDHVLAVLINHGLIEEVGRADTIGRPVLFGTTPGFLQAAGLVALTELPPLQDAPISGAADT